MKVISNNYIEFIKIYDKLGPDLIQRLAEEWDISPYYMFVGSLGDRFPYRMEELGSLRLII